MKVIVFDLDNTLYDEMTYVRSGFISVCEYLEQRVGVPVPVLLNRLMEELHQNGRGQVFNRVLEEYGLGTKSNVRHCLNVYRQHQPSLRLFSDAEHFINRFSSYPMYIVTDGNKLVQQRKLEALGLDSHPIRKAFITRRYGIYREKPSPYCFKKICDLEKTDPSNVFYIGDNPKKDFVGIKPEGFQTVRILRGEYASLIVEPAYEAKYVISHYYELGNLIMKGD